MSATNPTIVIVAYRNTCQLETALKSLGPGHPLIVVDNGADNDVRSLIERYGGIYIAPDRNVGFAAGVNIAIAAMKEGDVLLLNPDVLASPEMPATLAMVLHEDPGIAAVAPRLVYPNGEPQRVIWPIPSPREAWIEAFRLRRALRPRGVFLAGAVLLIKSTALADVGRFDERFFLYAEECDWQLRALRRGWRLKLAGDVVAVHVGAGSSEAESDRVGYSLESAELFGRKWYGLRGWRSMRAASLFGAAMRLVVSVHRPQQRARYRRELRWWWR